MAISSPLITRSALKAPRMKLAQSSHHLQTATSCSGQSSDRRPLSRHPQSNFRVSDMHDMDSRSRSAQRLAWPDSNSGICVRDNRVRGTSSVTVIRTAKCPVSMPSEKRQNMAKRIGVWGAYDAIKIFCIVKTNRCRPWRILSGTAI